MILKTDQEKLNEGDIYAILCSTVQNHFLNVNLKLCLPPQLKQSSVDNLGKLSSTFFSWRMTFKRKLILVVLLEKPPEVFL